MGRRGVGANSEAEAIVPPKKKKKVVAVTLPPSADPSSEKTVTKKKAATKKTIPVAFPENITTTFTASTVVARILQGPTMINNTIKTETQR